VSEEEALLGELIEELHEQLRSSQRENERLRHQLERLLRRLYGHRTGLSSREQPAHERARSPTVPFTGRLPADHAPHAIRVRAGRRSRSVAPVQRPHRCTRTRRCRCWRP
jgi:uncharacterized coiled-coil protein SlyX